MTKAKLKFKILITFLIFLFIGLLLLLFLNFYIKSSVKSSIISLAEAASVKADCILVLGAGIRPGGIPSDMLQDRLDISLKLFKSGASNRLLMSGDHGREDYDEVNTMKSYALKNGVSSDCVFMDHAGFSTYESIYRAKEIFCANKILIVTQVYHLYRALYIANSLGLEAYGVASDQRIYIGQTYRTIREVLARAKDFAMCIIKPEPTYLGEIIPVSGNGNITNDSFSNSSIPGKAVII